MILQKHKIAALITVAMTIAFFAALLWGYGQYQHSQRALALLENEYQRAYYNYLADIKDMTLVAGKLQSVEALQRLLLLDRLSALASSAADHMAQLPLEHSRYQRSVSYLNQVGDYAASLSQALARGESLPPYEKNNLSQIYQNLQDMYGQMAEMETAVAGGNLLFADKGGVEGWWGALRGSLAGGSIATQGAGAAAAENSADEFFSRADALLIQAEALHYQGKYAAETQQSPAWGLYGKRQFTADQALEAARKFLSLGGQGDLPLLGQQLIEADSSLPLYQFHFGGPEIGESKEADSLYVAVSRAGGEIISYLREQAAGKAIISPQTALGQAGDILEKAGYTQMRLIARQSLGQELLLSYVPYRQQILYYGEQVDIKMALDGSGLAAFNSQAYWQHKRERDLALPVAGFETNQGQLALLRDEGGREILCYEQRHPVANEEYLLYNSVEEALEERVLRAYQARDGSFYTR